MCMGGSNKAAKEAKQAENARQQGISENVQSINRAFGGREQQYADFTKALRANYQRQLKQTQDETGRQLKFSQARSGLTGGSAAVDQNAIFNRESDEAAIQAERKALAGEAGLRNADEQSRLSMISLAQSGSDIGNAATQTANALRANIEGARSDGLAEGLGDVFGNTAQVYKKEQEASQFRKGLNDVYGKAFARV